MLGKKQLTHLVMLVPVGTGINMATLGDGDGVGPAVGSVVKLYHHDLDCTPGCPTATNNKVEIRVGGGTSVIVGACAEILCAKPKVAKFGAGGASQAFSTMLPLDTSFVGLSYCVQGTCFNCGNGCTSLGTGLALSNSFTETVGI